MHKAQQLISTYGHTIQNLLTKGDKSKEKHNIGLVTLITMYTGRFTVVSGNFVLINL